MIINKITGDVCKTTQSLWKEVFSEDSTRFTDYYFENKAEKNIGYVIGTAPFDAMMFRTPYQLQIGQVRKEISYLVGVATRKGCRHKGYMRALLTHAIKEMYQEKNPFTFLMPANPAIYKPFDFEYIYERDIWELKEPEKMIPLLEALTLRNKKNKSDFHKLTGLYSVRSLRKQSPDFPVMNLLAEFANDYLKEHYHIYVHRDASYYEMQLKESEAQNGDIYVLFDKGIINGFFVYAKEGEEIFLQEVLEAEEGILDFLQRSGKKKPIIMARIIHLEEMMKLVCSRENITTTIEVKDELIPENAGIYRWEITSQGSKINKISQEVNLSERENKEDTPEIPKVSMHIRELAVKILTGGFINEIV